MATHFITVLNGKISGQHCGDIKADFSCTPYNGHDRVEIPPSVNVSTGDRIEYYSKKWERISDVQLIKEGIMPIPEGYVLEEDILRPMTAIERINFGLEDLQPGYKIENGEILPMSQLERVSAGLEKLQPGLKFENNEIVPMSNIEQLESGQITQEEFDQRIAEENSEKLQSRLAELLTPEMLAQAEIDEVFATERKAMLVALLAVKKQPGWPVMAIWP